MRFIKIGPLTINALTELKGYQPTKNEKGDLIGVDLFIRDGVLPLTGALAQAVTWLFSLPALPRQENGDEFFVLDLLRAYKNRNKIEIDIARRNSEKHAEAQLAANPPATNPPQLEYLVAAVAQLQQVVGQLVSGRPEQAGQSALIQSAHAVPAPPPGPVLVPSPHPPSVRLPKLNTNKIREGVLQRGKGPVQFFPGETPGDQEA